MRVLLIIPAYNEEKNILKVCNNIEKHNKSTPPPDQYDYIVINDCSTDSTSQICHEHNIPVIDLVHNLGIGGAVQTGYRYADYHDYDVAVQFDGDGQHNVQYVKNILKPIEQNHSDLVIGSRYINNDINTFKSSFTRRLGIKIISYFIYFVTNQKIKDTTSGFRACNKNVIKEFSNDYPLEYPEPITTTELIKKHYRIKEVSVSMNARTAGTSSINSWKNVYYMLNVCLSLLVVKIRRYTKCR